jgi:hypothetical protein
MNLKRCGATAVALAATLTLGLAGCSDGDSDSESDGESTTIGFSQIADSGVSGEVDLRQEGNRVVGRIEVTGLDSGTAHAMHIHGVTGEDHGCAESERTTNHMIELPDIEADDQGVGVVDLDVEGPSDAIREGTYIMVHQNPGGMAMDESQSEGTDETSEAKIILVHEGEDHSTPEEAETHAMGDNPPIACAEFTDR